MVVAVHTNAAHASELAPSPVHDAPHPPPHWLGQPPEVFEMAGAEEVPGRCGGGLRDHLEAVLVLLGDPGVLLPRREHLAHRAAPVVFGQFRSGGYLPLPPSFAQRCLLLL